MLSLSMKLRSCFKAALAQSCPLHTSSLIALYRKVRRPCFEALWSGGYHEYIGGYHEYIGGYHEYIGGISWVHWGMFSTSGGYNEYIGGYYEYIGGYYEYIGGYHEYIGGYHEYIRGISWVHRVMFCTSEGTMVHRGDNMSTLGDIMSTLGDVQCIGEILWVHRGILWVHWGISWVQWGDIMMHVRGYHEYIGVFNTNQRFLSTCSPTWIMMFPPMYSRHYTGWNYSKQEKDWKSNKGVYSVVYQMLTLFWNTQHSNNLKMDPTQVDKWHFINSCDWEWNSDNKFLKSVSYCTCTYYVL